MINNYPYPIIDIREKELIKTLADEYTKFAEPGIFLKATNYLKDGISNHTPQKVKDISNQGLSKIQNYLKKATEAEFIQTTLEHVVKGYGHFNETLSKYTLNQNSTIKDLRRFEPNLEFVSEICLFRSYNIESRETRLDIIPLSSALLNGGATGYFGIWGVPFNLVISLFLYFRFVQEIAMYYGYNVQDDPRELEFASDVVLECLFPSKETGSKNLAGAIGRIKLQSEFEALKISLKKGLTFEKLINNGGIEIAYVQIRSFGNKAARNALDKAGIEQAEVGIFKKLMERVGGFLSKNATKRAIPGISALIGALSDVYYMKRILKGANIIYHKRFLLEKESRIKRLYNIIDYPNEITVTDVTDEPVGSDLTIEPKGTKITDSNNTTDESGESNVTENNDTADNTK